MYLGILIKHDDCERNFPTFAVFVVFFFILRSLKIEKRITSAFLRARNVEQLETFEQYLKVGVEWRINIY